MTPMRYVDLNLKEKTLELIFKLRGDFATKPELKSTAEELFEDTPVE